MIKPEHQLEKEKVNISILQPLYPTQLSIKDVIVTDTLPANRQLLKAYSKCIIEYSSHSNAVITTANRDTEIIRLRTKLLDHFLNNSQSETPTFTTTLDRIQYVTDLWPQRPVLGYEQDVRDYYGFEVVLKDHTTDEPTANRSSSLSMPESGTKLDGPTEYAYSQDSWVQCDGCEKWRRLPDHVDVAKLPSIWYCHMNQWDSKHNNCSVEEEIVSAPARENDVKELRRRTFVKHFIQRLKRIEKTNQEFKNTDTSRNDVPGRHRYVQCTICFKKRPILPTMDLAKIPQPFVCWMNKWDELHSSCVIPEEPVLYREDISDHMSVPSSKDSNLKKKTEFSGPKYKVTKKQSDKSATAGTIAASSNDDGSSHSKSKTKSSKLDQTLSKRPKKKMRK